MSTVWNLFCDSCKRSWVGKLEPGQDQVECSCGKTVKVRRVPLEQTGSDTDGTHAQA